MKPHPSFTEKKLLVWHLICQRMHIARYFHLFKFIAAKLELVTLTSQNRPNCRSIDETANERGVSRRLKPRSHRRRRPVCIASAQVRRRNRSLVFARLRQCAHPFIGSTGKRQRLRRSVRPFLQGLAWRCVEQTHKNTRRPHSVWCL